MANEPVQLGTITPQTITSPAPNTPSQAVNLGAPKTPVAPSSSQILSPNAPRQIIGPGEMVVIQSSVRTPGQSGVTATAKRVASMDATLNTVKLNNGQYVNKADFDALTPAQQSFLKANGIDAFNASIKASVVKLDNGDYVSKESFDTLTPEQQAFLKTRGIAAFNEESGKIMQEAKFAAEMSRIIAEQSAVQQAQYEASMLVKLDNGEYVTKNSFNILTPEQQAQLRKLGVAGFNQWAKVQAPADTIKLNTGEYVSKAEYAKLTPAQQQQLMTLGIEKFNQQAKAAPVVTTTAPLNTVKLDNGDYVPIVDFNKLPLAEQQKLKSLGVDGYNASINALKAGQSTAQSKLYAFAMAQLPTGYYGPAQITGQTILDYLAANRNSVEAQTVVKAAGYDITTADAQTGLSLTQIASKLVADRDKVGSEIQTVLSSGKGADALISAIQNSGFYDASKFNATATMLPGAYNVIYVDNVTGKALSNGDLAQRLWNSLTSTQRAQVTDAFGADVYRGNYYSEQIKIMAQFAEKGGIMGQIIFGPLLTMQMPLAKVLVNQPVSAQEWAAAGATAIITAATLGGPPVGGIPGLIGQVLVTGATATLTGLSIEQTVKNWGVMSTPERVISVAADVIGLAGTIVSGVSTVKAGIKVIDTVSATRAAVKAGDAYNSMIKTLDSANAEAAQRGLVTADTNTKLQLAISESRSADTTFLNKFSNLDRVDVTQLDKFEKLSGFNGLSQAVQDLTKARTALDTAWQNVAAQTDPVKKIQALTEAQTMRDAFFSKLNDLGDITTPRTGPTISVVWDDIIDVTKADILRVEKALTNEKQYLATKINPDMTTYNELRSNLDTLNKNLDTYVQSKSSGQWQGAPAVGLEGAIARAQLRIHELERALSDETISAQTQSSLQKELVSAKNQLAEAQTELSQLPAKTAEYVLPKDLGTELNDFLNHQGRYSPEFQAAQRLVNDANAHTERMFYDDHGFWPSGSPQYPGNQGYTGEQVEVTPAVQSAAVATKAPEITPTQMSLNVLLQDVISQPTAAEPRMLADVAPMAVAKIPGVGTAAVPVPLLTITPFGLASKTYAAEYVASLTPEQFTQVFGDQVKVQPTVIATAPLVASVSGVSLPQTLGTTWVSPAEAVKLAQATNVSTYVQAILAQAERAVNEVLLVTTDDAKLKAAQQTTIQTYLETITNSELREAVEAELANIIEPVTGITLHPGTAITQHPATGIEQHTATGISIHPTDMTETLINTETAVQQLTGTEIMSAVQTAQQEATEVQTQTQQQTRVQQETKTMTEMEPLTRVESIIPTEITPVIIVPPIIPIIPGASATKKRKQPKEFPAGTAVWKMGFVWKIIPPPYNIVKPISRRKAPVGVRVLEGSPQETLTFLGGAIPFKDISFDLGVVDGYIDVKAQKIIFTGEGEKTKVGLSLPEPTKGITFPAVAEGRARAIAAEQRDALGLTLATRKAKVTIPKKIHRKPNMLVQTGS